MCVCHLGSRTIVLLSETRREQSLGHLSQVFIQMFLSNSSRIVGLVDAGKWLLGDIVVKPGETEAKATASYKCRCATCKRMHAMCWRMLRRAPRPCALFLMQSSSLPVPHHASLQPAFVVYTISQMSSHLSISSKRSISRRLASLHSSGMGAMAYIRSSQRRH